MCELKRIQNFIVEHPKNDQKTAQSAGRLRPIEEEVMRITVIIIAVAFREIMGLFIAPPTTSGDAPNKGCRAEVSRKRGQVPDVGRGCATIVDIPISAAAIVERI